MPLSSTSTKAETRWAVRVIPCIIVAAFAFATYAIVPHLCVDYLFDKKGRRATAVALIVLYFLFFLLSILAYLRTFVTVKLNPGLVPLSAEREALDIERRSSRRYGRPRARESDPPPWNPPDDDPDSPGLEAFYSKDLFICEQDGRPKWCSECRAWKPDRAHHSSELGRCARKMDHVCVWTGGLVSETSFNFFVQFTFYCSLYCTVCLATAAYSLRSQRSDGRSLDGVTVAAVALSAFFGFFTMAMTMTAGRFVLRNITNIDMLRKNQVYHVAVRVPLNSPSTDKYQTITYPLPRPSWSPTHGPANGYVGGSVRRESPVSARDRQARRTFAILRTEPGENPWDVGYWNNFKSVMGNNLIEWLLPIRHSPCCNHDSMVSDYEFGRLLGDLKKRYMVPDCNSSDTRGIEMRDTNAAMSETDTHGLTGTGVWDEYQDTDSPRD